MINSYTSEHHRMIAYEDSDVRVIWLPGASRDLVVITFGDLVTLADGEHFFADGPLERLGLPSVGFMAKFPNWYPATSMRRASEVILPLTQSFNRRVGYGGSMGGYAVLKYGRLLGLNTAIALCPQWSIDPSEWDNFDPGWQANFEPRMQGMGIVADDLPQSAFIFFDCFDARDQRHAAKIGALSATVTSITVPFTEHHVTSVLAGGANLSDLIKAALDSDERRMRKIARLARRSHPRRLVPLLNRNLDRYGAAVAYQLLQDRGNPAQQVAKDQYGTILRAILKQSDVDLAKAWVLAFGNMSSSPLQTALLLAILAPSVGIHTYHNTVCVFDLITGKARHIAHESMRPHELPIYIKVNGITAFLIVRGGPIELALDVQDGLILCGRSSAELIFEWSDRPGFYLRRESKYLCAEPNGDLIFDRLQPADWERFYF